MRCDVVICAHNEQATVGRVLEAVSGSSEVGTTIVVADACTDATAEVATRAGALVLQTDAHNKGSAMALGLAWVGTEHVVFIDADISGLLPGHVDALCTRGPSTGQYVGCRDGYPLAFLIFPSVSGERRVPTSIAHRARLAGSGWEAETRLNVAVAQAGLPWLHEVLVGVHNRHKVTRDPWGWARELGHVATVMATYGPELVRYTTHPSGE